MARKRPKPCNSLTDDDAAFLGDLISATQGAALLLNVSQEHVKPANLGIVVLGVSEVLDSVSKRADDFFPEKIDKKERRRP